MTDRKKVIKGLEAHEKGCGYRSHYCDVMECPYRYGDESCDIEEMCHDAIALLKEHEWIPVEKRVPTSMANKVLVYLTHEDYVDCIGYGHYEKFQGHELWYDLESNQQFSVRGYTVTHWMPMPLSPNGEKLLLS